MTDTAVPPIGSRWQENDKRFTRIVEVVHGFDEVEKKVRVKNVETGRITWAQIRRFSDKPRSHGYTRIP